MFEKHILRLLKNILQKSKSLFQIWISKIKSFLFHHEDREILIELPINNLSDRQVSCEENVIVPVVDSPIETGSTIQPTIALHHRQISSDSERKIVEPNNRLPINRLNESVKRLLSNIPQTNSMPSCIVLMHRKCPFIYSDVKKNVVVISSGMLCELDDDELMMVIGHEMAYFLIHDEVSSWPRFILKWTFPFLLIYSWVILGPTALVLVVLMILVYATLADWDMVHRADRMGIEMAVAAGADASAGRTFFEKPTIHWVDSPLPSLTHPSVRSRLQEMRNFENEWKRPTSSD